MKLEKLSIKNIRNIHEIEIECSSGIHFIYGSNGQGKTSILESIYLLSNLRSFRDSDLSALIRLDCPFAQVKGSFRINHDTVAELRVDLVKNGSRVEKRAYINHKLSKSAVDYFGVKLHHSPVQFHAINLNPTSTDLIRGEPGLRRTYLNQVLSSENPEYLNVLKRYQKVVDQKNALLKQEFGYDLEFLKILNEKLAQEGAFLIHARLIYLQKIADPIHEFLAKIAPSQAPVNLGYFSKVFEGEPLYFNRHFEVQTIEFLTENLHQKLAQNGTQEKLRRSSLIGPHRDDILFTVQGRDILDVGSQGEIRSLLLALKLSELEEFTSHTGVQPVLLIDDFSSELDTTRRSFLLNYLKDSDLQIFVTTTDNLVNEKIDEITVLKMNQGFIEGITREFNTSQ